MNLSKRIRDNNDKKVLFESFGRVPKTRCPVCHRFSLWVPKKGKHKFIKDNSKELECVMCELIKRTKEEEDGKGNNSQPKDN